MTFDAVRAAAARLSDVEAGTIFGKPALKTRGQMFACLASHKSAEPNSLVVRMDFDRRDALIAADPAVYYVTDHYVGYPSVLVRLDRVRPDALSDLLRVAWRYVSETQPRRRPRRLANVRRRRSV